MTATKVDETEQVRREMLPIINSAPDDAIEGKTWATAQMTEEFEVIGFAAPLVVVRKRDTGEKGSLMFRHSPRIYFGWDPHKP